MSSHVQETALSNMQAQRKNTDNALGVLVVQPGPAQRAYLTKIDVSYNGEVTAWSLVTVLRGGQPWFHTWWLPTGPGTSGSRNFPLELALEGVHGDFGEEIEVQVAASGTPGVLSYLHVHWFEA